jgi:hypothetical protein
MSILCSSMRIAPGGVRDLPSYREWQLDDGETELCKLATKYVTDKWNYHHYTPHYHNLFKDRRNEVKKVLEIGIGDAAMAAWHSTWDYKPGASLRMWEEYFPNAEIYALDIDPTVLINQGRIHSLLCDQGSEESLRNALPWLGKDFDFIVDDGSHALPHQALSVYMLVPLLAPNGIYVIEDVWHFIEPSGNCPNPLTHVLNGISYPSEFIHCSEGHNDDHLVVIRAQQ